MTLHIVNIDEIEYQSWEHDDCFGEISCKR